MSASHPINLETHPPFERREGKEQNIIHTLQTVPHCSCVFTPWYLPVFNVVAPTYRGQKKLTGQMSIIHPIIPVWVASRGDAHPVPLHYTKSQEVDPQQGF